MNEFKSRLENNNLKFNQIIVLLVDQPLFAYASVLISPFGIVPFGVERMYLYSIGLASVVAGSILDSTLSTAFFFLVLFFAIFTRLTIYVAFHQLSLTSFALVLTKSSHTSPYKL